MDKVRDYKKWLSKYKFLTSNLHANYLKKHLATGCSDLEQSTKLNEEFFNSPVI